MSADGNGPRLAVDYHKEQVNLRSECSHIQVAALRSRGSFARLGEPLVSSGQER